MGLTIIRFQSQASFLVKNSFMDLFHAHQGSCPIAKVDMRVRPGRRKLQGRCIAVGSCLVFLALGISLCFEFFGFFDINWIVSKSMQVTGVGVVILVWNTSYYIGLRRLSSG